MSLWTKSCDVTIQMKPLRYYFQLVLFLLVCSSNFWVSGWNPMVLPSKWNLLSRIWDLFTGFIQVYSILWKLPIPSAFPHTVTDHIKQLASGTDLVEDFTQKCKKEEAVSAIITIYSLITISILKILLRGEGPWLRKVSLFIQLYTTCRKFSQISQLQNAVKLRET